MEAAAAASEAQSVYTGERKNGRMEGYGTYRFPSGTVYTGDCACSTPPSNPSA